MTNYKSNGSVGKKLLVPAVALLLCAFALVGAGYAAYQSSVGSGGNEVATDGIVVSFTKDGTESGEIVVGATLKWTSHKEYVDENSAHKYKYASFDENDDVDGKRLIGEITLKIDTEGTTSKKATVSQELEITYSGGDELPEGLDYIVEIDSVDITDNSTVVDFDTEDTDSEYTIKIYLTNDESKVYDDKPPLNFEFRLVVSVTPTS